MRRSLAGDHEPGSPLDHRSDHRGRGRRGVGDVLALQVRASTRATRLSAMREMSDAFNRWLQAIADSPELADLYARAIRDYDSIQGADVPRFSALMDHMFRIYEEMYFQNMEGHLDPRVWRGFEAPMRDLVAYPGIQAWWRSRCHWFSADFRTFIQGHLEKGIQPQLYREPRPEKGSTKTPLTRWRSVTNRSRRRSAWCGGRAEALRDLEGFAAPFIRLPGRRRAEASRFMEFSIQCGGTLHPNKPRRS